MTGSAPRAAAVVLAGGRSARMGTDKATLEWHGSTLLRRVAGVVCRAVTGPVVVVRAPGQSLPSLPAGVEVCEDPHEGLGPLQGLATGLHAVGATAELAFVCATDMPLLHVAFVRRVLRGFAGGNPVEVVLPVVGGLRHPLGAGYRTDLAGRIDELLSSGERALGALLARCVVAPLADAALQADPEVAARDPQLDSVINLNRASDYARARSRPAPDVIVHLPGGEEAGRRVRAATLGRATEAAGGVLDGHVAVVGGSCISRDPELPLVSGDTVQLHRADD